MYILVEWGFFPTVMLNKLFVEFSFVNILSYYLLLNSHSLFFIIVSGYPCSWSPYKH